MGVGLSAAGVATFFERFRPAFLIVAAFLLGVGFYLNYFRKDRCAPGDACESPNPRLRRMNRGILWISTVFVVAFALFPSYVGLLLGADKISAETVTASTETWKISIEGMTCAGCEAAVTASLLELPGVERADVSYETANAVLAIDPTNPPTRVALAAAVGKAGYVLVAVNEKPTAKAPPLEGHWVTEVEEQNGDVIEIVMDLGIVNSKWVGEFDIPKYDVMDYPVEVKRIGDTIELFLTAIGMSFEGTIVEDGSLSGVGRSPDQEEEPVTFNRTGPAEFSDGFLELEAAADDSLLVEILSGNAAELRKRFNTDSDKTRLLMLLSPT
jgi:copper chaperone CopZ